MTEEQRQQRAAFLRERPGFWLFLLYAVTFVGYSVASDVLQLASGGAEPSRFQRYLLPLVIAWPMWVLLCASVRRLPAPGVSAGPVRTPPQTGRAESGVVNSTAVTAELRRRGDCPCDEYSP